MKKTAAKIKTLAEGVREYRDQLLIHLRCDECLKAQKVFLPWLCMDLIRSRLTERTTLQDYFLYQFYRLDPSERSRFLTERDRKDFCDRTTSPEMFRILNDKEETLVRFGDYVGRDWCGVRYNNSDTEYRTFAEKHRKAVIKPMDGYGGRNVRIMDLRDVDLKKLCHDENVIAEEVISQHQDMAEIYPLAVNTVRVVTMEDNIVGASIRMGVGGAAVDNVKAGGIYAEIDIDKGLITTDAMNSYGQIFRTHPDTGTQLKGREIPFWKDITKIIRQAIVLTRGCPLVGWDFAVTDAGPVIVEVNSHPGLYSIQAPACRGVRRKIIKETESGTPE